MFSQFAEQTKAIVEGIEAALFYTPGASVRRAERPRHPADLRGPARADVEVLHRRIHVALHHALMKLLLGFQLQAERTAGVMGVAFVGERRARP